MNLPLAPSTSLLALASLAAAGMALVAAPAGGPATLQERAAHRRAPAERPNVSGGLLETPTGVPIPGERIPASAVAPGVIEDWSAVLARAADGGDEALSLWTVGPDGRAQADGLLGLGLDGEVELEAALVAAADAAGPLRVRALGFRGGEPADSSGWIGGVGEAPVRLALGLYGVDRVVLEARDGLGREARIALAGLTLVRGGVRQTVDTAGLEPGTVLSGSRRAGLVWEAGTAAPAAGLDLPASLSGPLGSSGTSTGAARSAPQAAREAGPATAAKSSAVAMLPNVVSHFAGPNQSDPGAAWFPPDASGAAGPAHFVAVVNEHLSVYDKASGTRVLSTSLDAFFGGNAAVLKQYPRVVYDQHAGRWVMIACDLASGIHFAWSTSSDPTGSWYKTFVTLATGADAGTTPDYPTLGLDLNGIYVSALMIGNSASLFAIDKLPLLATTPTIQTVTAWRMLPFEGALQPCVTFDVPAGCYVTSRFDIDTHRIRRIDPPLATPTLTQMGFVDTKNGLPPPTAAALGSSIPLDTLDARQMNAVYRNGSVWFTHHVDKDGRSAVNWYELDPVGLTVVQEGTVKSGTDHYLYPTIAVNLSGDAVLGFSASSASDYAGVWYTGRAAADPAGEMGAAVAYRSGSGPYNQVSQGKNRWGYYSATCVDPLDDLGFWTIQERARGGGVWDTEVAQLRFTGCAPPTASAPADATRCPGTSVTLTTVAAGTGGLSYQWQHDGADVPGATAASLTIASVAVADAGVYACVVTDSCGSTISPSALLTVDQPATASAPASVIACTGSNAVFATNAGGTGPFTYQWRKDGIDIPGATASSLTLNSVTTANNGLYDVVVSGSCGSSATSAPATLSVDDTVSTTDPVDTTACSGSAAVFSTTPTGAGPFTYQWRKDGIAITGATAADLVIPSVSVASEADYDVVVTGACGSTTSAAATLTVANAVSASNPASQSGCPGVSVAFLTSAGGTGPFSYQWKKDGVAIPGATAGTYAIPSIAMADAGAYSVLVTGACNTIETAQATLTVLPPTGATAPLPATVCSGGSTSFSTVASGTGPFTYQWKKNGVELSGATGPSYSIPFALPADAGAYSVEVSGACDTVETTAATLTVETAPGASDPQPVTACPGSPAAFSTTPTGTGPFGFQWKQDGANIPGATASSYSIASVTPGSAGAYSVQVTGACGSYQTASATLTVASAVTATDPVDKKVCPGGPVTFSTTAGGTGPFTYQWKKDNAPIPGATASSYSIAAVANGDKGDYSVVVTGACGSLETAKARLTLGIDVTRYCTAGISASGCQPMLAATGTPSASSPSGFVVVATGVEGNKDGLFFFGKTGRQANTWGNGSSYQCVLPPVKRGGLLNALGSNGACDGLFAQDLNAHWQIKPSHNPGAGALVQLQLWYRDPQNTSNQSTSLSDALEFPVCP